jgi:outer membrane lipoprotein-sorting protein
MKTLCISTIITITVCAFFLSMTSVFAEENGHSIIKKSRSLKQAADMQGTAVMILIDANGNKNTRKIDMYTRTTKAGTDSLSEFLFPADVKGTKFLTIGNKEKGDDQRLWLPALGKVRKIAASAKDGKFMGSDLTYYDMEEHSFDGFEYTYLRGEVLTIKKDGHKIEQECWVVESVPKNGESPYSKTEVWVSKDDYFVYRSDFWNRKGEKEKNLYIIESATIDGIIVPVKTYVESADGHKTLLQIKDIRVNEGVDDSLFTVNYLMK